MKEKMLVGLRRSSKLVTTSSVSAFFRSLVVTAIILGASAFSSNTSSSLLARLDPGLLPAAKSMHRSTAISASHDPHHPPANADVCIRILCLHGKGGNGERFANAALLPLRSLVETRVSKLELGCDLSFQWDELTAPYEMIPPGNGKNGGYSWWTMPPGVRSYNAKEYEGFGKSATMVMEKVFSTEPDGADKTDIILGHSQGAILTAALLSIHDGLWQSSPLRPSGYILNGAAWPNPYIKSLMSLAQQCRETTDSLPRMLFITGRADNINPVESAMRVRDAFRAAEFHTSVVNHAGGHSVPAGDDEDSSRALDEVVDW
eukprot:CAMPEP_0172548824 /NCGR_PEP_ID=MMETSP1067-20121228/18036_1 /TAXON_ID=265564 ORGANISM="Thalassiosira punctigera, Strain Tpunct2005C2" /NCGR_SAMPLE_ID=MMETSP1067 /ASSEMBLY_ACC=CAM_ASM_000444 /LENGTH=317 /DNA_ID=CAMNT_0013336101 /DNA_START=18 /DNA_END=968 /DNA_ORIENTATION=-